MKSPVLNVSEARSEFGNPQPQIEVSFSPRVSYWLSSAYLYALASRVDARTPKGATWCNAQVKRDIVWLELMTGSKEEVAAAMKVLNDVAQNDMEAILAFIEL